MSHKNRSIPARILTMHTRFIVCLLLFTLFALRTQAATARELASWLRTIRSVESEGRGNAEANRAWQEIAKLDAKHLPDVLTAMDGANSYALNWLRAGVDTI